MIINKVELDDLVDSKEEIRRVELPDGSFTYCYMVAFPDTFEHPLARECRGLIMGKSGCVIRRPFDKFFNVNEKEETQESILNGKTIESIYEKVDGSMIAPWIDSRGILNFDTKKLNLEMRTKINELVPNNIYEFSRDELQIGYQPIFELYHPDIPETNIVVEYNKPVWRLLALRNLATGEYANDANLDKIAELHGLERPKRYEVSNRNTSDVVNWVKSLEELEGVVIRYTDGTRAKCKCQWYLDRHHLLDMFNYEHKMARMVLNEGSIDDVSALLTPARLNKYTKFSEELHRGMRNIKEHVISKAKSFKTKKDYGLSGEQDEFSNIVFKLIGADIGDSEVFNMVKEHISCNFTKKTVLFAALKETKGWNYVSKD